MNHFNKHKNFKSKKHNEEHYAVGTANLIPTNIMNKYLMPFKPTVYPSTMSYSVGTFNLDVSEGVPATIDRHNLSQ
jgi:hypothetical protein